MKKQKKYEFLHGIYTESELLNAVFVLADIREEYDIFDEEESTKSRACSVAIDAIGAIVCADSGRGEQK